MSSRGSSGPARSRSSTGTREDGRAEGFAEGLAEGEAKGRSEGKAEGLAEGKVLIAKAMIEEGIDTNTIAKVTGLSCEEVKSL